MNEPVRGAGGPDAASIRAQLQRILAAGAFRTAPVLSRFLRYLVECRLSDAQAPPKEYAVGVDVFARGAGFDPRVDTIVRVQARRLRKRLDRYYETDGRADPLRISIPTGHYLAEVSPRRAGPEAADASGGDAASATPAGAAFRSGTVPAPRTPLVGRAREVDELCALLTDGAGPRLVTLTGAGGSGKTRLAIAAGLRLQQQGRDDVRYVRLAAVPDAATFELAMLRALGLRALDDTPPLDLVCAHLRAAASPVLLILDNFEQLVAAAPLVGALLDTAVGHRIVVTSRVPLHLYGEHQYRVAPLALPAGAAMPLAELAAVPAIELFVQRAAAVAPGFALTAGDAEAVVRICAGFDGLPLGIELAAAQCRTATPTELLDRLPERLGMQAGNLADVPDRQRTMRRAIEWSHRLLAPAEQRLYARLAVFAGGFTLEAARAVTDTQRDLGIDVDAGVVRLRECNLLFVFPEPGEARFGMLEVVRAHAVECLAASGDGEAVRRAHAAYCLALAQDGMGRLTAAVRRDWLVRCDRERDNFQAALDGLIARGEARFALLLVCALYRYWERHEHTATARHSLAAVLNRFPPSAAPQLWIQAACCAGTMEGRAGNPAIARTRLAAALATARAGGDHDAEVMALNCMAINEHFQHHHKRALALYAETLRRCETERLQARLAAALSNLAVGHLVLGDHAAARTLTQRAQALFKRQREWVPATWCINQLGDIATVAGDDATAERHYREAARRFQRLGAFRGVARCWSDLGHLALLQGRHAEAAALFADALRIHARLEFQRGVAGILEGCAMLAAARGDGARALTMAGAAEAVRVAHDLIAYPYQRRRLERALVSARRTLGSAAAAECLQRGRALDLRQAVAYAQACLGDLTTRPGPAASAA